MQKRRRKYQRKQDLAHIKARWALFQQSADTKDLDDIPRYWTQAQQLKLPVIQYTARDVRRGLLFWAFAEGRSASASAVFAARIQQHLDRYGVSLRDLVWQTDNGGEFKGDSPKTLGDSRRHSHAIARPASSVVAQAHFASMRERPYVLETSGNAQYTQRPRRTRRHHLTTPKTSRNAKEGEVAIAWSGEDPIVYGLALAALEEASIPLFEIAEHDQFVAVPQISGPRYRILIASSDADRAKKAIRETLEARPESRD